MIVYNYYSNILLYYHRDKEKSTRYDGITLLKCISDNELSVIRIIFVAID